MLSTLVTVLGLLVFASGMYFKIDGVFGFVVGVLTVALSSAIYTFADFINETVDIEKQASPIDEKIKTTEANTD